MDRVGRAYERYSRFVSYEPRCIIILLLLVEKLQYGDYNLHL
jgi:hypothetical protein